ncbi:MAG TPA: TIGR03118 family protein [Acidobacteriaceae bacterium]|jgi:uncharacterized protein (TIGR03118 family)|nr:TIGR03118 family protein [Acidobacteriaceae bacterium]
MPAQTRLRLFIAAAIALPLATAAHADTFVQTNLVSNVPNLAAHTDPNLVNPWGMSFSATSPFWTSDQAAGVATLYDGAGNINPLVVTIPGSTGGPSGPTGTVFNAGTSFLLNGAASRFIFANLNGTISAWNGVGTTASVVATTPGAIYTGLAISGNTLYAANSSAGRVDVFNSSFAPTTLPGSFTDPDIPAGFVPFNIQAIGSTLYVTYAHLGPGGAPLPGGFVDAFNADGTFAQRLASGGPLSAPWGITLAPSTFGSFGNDLLIGNFGNGTIDAFSTSGTFLGVLDGTNGQPLVNDFLWALNFRTGGPNVDTNALYFTAGINGEQGGLFGAITPATPEPSSLILAASGLLAGLTAKLRRRNRLA